MTEYLENKTLVGALSAALGICVVSIIAFIVTTMTTSTDDTLEQRRILRQEIADIKVIISRHEERIQQLEEGMADTNERISRNVIDYLRNAVENGDE